jgi:hypothetical protein
VCCHVILGYLYLDSRELKGGGMGAFSERRYLLM